MTNLQEPTENLHADAPVAASVRGLLDRRELAATAFERTRMPMVVADARAPDLPIVLANEAFLRLTGYSADEVLGRNCRFLQGPDTAERAVAEVRDAIIAEREGNVELLNYRKDGTTFWNRLHVTPIYDDDHNLLYFFGSQIDVTDYRKVQALEMSEHRLLMEIDHRTKNVLAIVESIVRLSNSANSAEYAAAIQSRVQALGRAHALLSEHGWAPIPVRDVIHHQVKTYGADRVIIHGPPFQLPALIVQPISLVIHELAANAARHGSLAAPKGKLHVSWEPDGDGISLHWVEIQGNTPCPGKAGFGTVMIDTIVEKQLRGHVERRWAESGLDINIAVPLPA